MRGIVNERETKSFSVQYVQYCTVQYSAVQHCTYSARALETLHATFFFFFSFFRPFMALYAFFVTLK